MSLEAARRLREPLDSLHPPPGLGTGLQQEPRHLGMTSEAPPNDVNGGTKLAGHHQRRATLLVRQLRVAPEAEQQAAHRQAAAHRPRLKARQAKWAYICRSSAGAINALIEK